MMYQTKLTPAEDDRAILEAMSRMANVSRKSSSDVYMKAGQNREKHLANHIQGTRGELAVARYLGLPWTGEGPNGRDHKDVGDYVEVRTTSYSNNLIVKHVEQLKNDASTPYVLVWHRGQATIQIIGWITLGDALDVGEHYEQRGIWYSRVHYPTLRDIKELQCLIRS